MRTAVAVTSIDAYRAHRSSGAVGKQASTVLAWIALHPLCSRKEVSRGTGIELASVCGRARELIDAGAIEEPQTKVCEVSGNTVAALRVCPVQPSLFGVAA